ncbi:hypothetical protein B5F33_07190 [Collinsella sp. An2]|nr:hypothetical protein B5F33_07190 [Collinsella sp. An2]
MKTVTECVRPELCYSCTACVNSCPTNCIEMTPTGPVGSLIPSVDAGRCLRCGRCLQVCPALHDLSGNEPISVYAAGSTNEQLRNHSSSGGIATEIARNVINAGGVVYGSAIVNLEVKHIRVTSLQGLAKLQGSKYVHSRIYDSYRQVRDDLAGGMLTLFIGVPCQVSGLVGYLSKIPENLILVDLLCHGAPSQDCFEGGIKLETAEDVSSIAFREGNRYCFRGFTTDGACVFEMPYRASYWLNGFVEGSIFRECCYSCKYAGIRRYGDITLGDFWGYKGALNVDDGINFVSVNTEKGASVWAEVSKCVSWEPRTLDEAVPYNHSLTAPASRPENYERFKHIYAKSGGAKALLGAYPSKTVFVLFRRLVRKHRSLYSFVTKLPLLGKRLMEYPE